MGRRPQPDCLSLGPGTLRAGPAGKLLCHSLQFGLGSQHSEKRKESSDSDTPGVEIPKGHDRQPPGLGVSSNMVVGCSWRGKGRGGGRARRTKKYFMSQQGNQLPCPGPKASMPSVLDPQPLGLTRRGPRTREQGFPEALSVGGASGSPSPEVTPWQTEREDSGLPCEDQPVQGGSKVPKLRRGPGWARAPSPSPDVQLKAPGSRSR